MEWSAEIRAGMVDLFDGKIFCADCGKRMYYKRQRIQRKDVVFRASTIAAPMCAGDTGPASNTPSGRMCSMKRCSTSSGISFGWLWIMINF